MDTIDEQIELHKKKLNELIEELTSENNITKKNYQR